MFRTELRSSLLCKIVNDVSSLKRGDIIIRGDRTVIHRTALCETGASLLFVMYKFLDRWIKTCFEHSSLILSLGESCEKERARLPHKIHPFILVVAYFLCICIVFNSVAETLVTWFAILCFLALHVLNARVDDESMCWRSLHEGIGSCSHWLLSFACSVIRNKRTSVEGSCSWE